LIESIEILIRHVPWLAAAWMTVTGASIGSFLNVVVYRLPAGISLWHPGSRCPSCHRPIRWYDNLPVLGWLRLRGRCRDCQASIAVRYPLVEAGLAVVFLSLWIQLVQRGLPAEFSAQELRVALLRFALSCVVLCVLVCVTLIDRDGQPMPWSLLWIGIAPAVLLQLAGPSRAQGVTLAVAGGEWLSLVGFGGWRAAHRAVSAGADRANPGSWRALATAAGLCTLQLGPRWGLGCGLLLIAGVPLSGWIASRYAGPGGRSSRGCALGAITLAVWLLTLAGASLGG